MIKFIHGILLLFIVILMLCTKGINEWISEPTDTNHVSWVGSHSNVVNNLSIVYHGWKIIKNKNDFEIGFKAKLFYHIP